MDPTSDLIREAAEHALSALNLKGDELKDAIAFTAQYAANHSSVRKRFTAALTDDSYVSKTPGLAGIVSGNVKSNTGLPSLSMPTVTRVRQRRHVLKIDHMLGPQTMEFFNSHYSGLFDITYTQSYSHDHSAAAASRKIESEEVMQMLRRDGADLLRSPVSTYDCSIIDVGGDWRYHHVRGHGGVHCDAPFLDARDITRDARKRLQMTSNFDNSHFVCRNKMQDCKLTAPYMMAIHSVLYTCPIIDICEAMASRGTYYFVGTMQLPDNMETIYTKYSDPDYDYTIEYVDPDLAAAGQYLPPALRVGVGKYMFSDSRQRMVYRYPAGQSCEYIHDRAVLLEKLHDGTYYIYKTDGLELAFEYKVVKRVGSLIYASIRLRETETPAHSIKMSTPVKPYTDCYMIRIDGNLLANFSIKFARSTDIPVPRQLFTAVAVYCMTKVRNPTFSIEEAVAYGFSASNQIEANGVVLHEGVADGNRNVMVITASVASFFFAFDRYRLIEHRIPQLSVADASAEVQHTIASTLGSFVGFKDIFDSIKSVFIKAAGDATISYVIDKGTTYDDIRTLYEQLSAITTPGITRIRDMSHCYLQLQPLHVDTNVRDRHYSSRFVNAAIFVKPTYELEPTSTVKTLRQKAAELRETHAASGSSIYVKPVAKAEDLTLKSTMASQSSGSQGIQASSSGKSQDHAEYQRKVIEVALDAINMVCASEDERLQSAKETYLRVFDPDTRGIRSMETLKGTVKGKPLFITFKFGEAHKITSLEFECHKGEELYRELIRKLDTERFIYPKRQRDGQIDCGFGVLTSDGAFRDDDTSRLVYDDFIALQMPDLKILNSKNLVPLKSIIRVGSFPPAIQTTLANECAGSGKTHDQCQRYKTARELGKRPAIFASTRAAANQAKTRLETWKVDILPYSISTVDSYLMNPIAWSNQFDEVYIDEALQLHAGKIYCILKLANPSVLRGYGDRNQIGYIPFTRFHTPSTSTEFPWTTEQRNLVTRRIPNDDKIVPWLKSATFYGPEFKSISKRRDAVVTYSSVATIEAQITLPILYSIMGIRSHEELMILVYLQDEASRLRSKFDVDRIIPPREDTTKQYRACVCTMGEAQGEDVDNVIVLRLSSKQEPLHADAGQTTVALTRHKRRWAYLTVFSQFPTLIELSGGLPVIHNGMRSVITSAKVIEDD